MFGIWGTETHLVYRKDLPLRGFDEVAIAGLEPPLAS